MRIDVAEVHALTGKDHASRYSVVSYVLTIYRVGVLRYSLARMLRCCEREPELGRDVFGKRTTLLVIPLNSEDALRLYPRFTRQFNDHWVLSRLDRRIQKG